MINFELNGNSGKKCYYSNTYFISTLALQLSLLLQGGWGESSKLVIGPISNHLEEDDLELTTTMQPMTTLPMTTLLPDEIENNGSLVIFDRVYNEST